MAADKKVLIVLSDDSSFPLYKGDGKTVPQESGYFLMELAKPLQKILDAGYEVTFASPEGKEPTPDPLSLSLAAFAGNYYERKRELALIERMKKENGFSRPRKFSEITNEELRNYSGVFIPGGHAPLSDLGDNPELGRILHHFHISSKPTAALCHGPWAFLSTKYGPSEKFEYAGYKMTSWSDAEEKLMETIFRGEIDKVEGTLRKEGVDMQEGLAKSLGSITVDRELITGDNPMSADALGNKFLEMLATK
ncbi:class I glutamine amidotransferase-like protein [Parathielavia appendiculata]|uniref:D-lactate dehydratase n=1 Tax=Parathielavia appendiculata TaxID=2587402 RepID=A0AAN6TPY6_9PEZI|nr:class I glutamine amidotransferase-like protein [Parathielavia appendiculata]